MMDVGRFPPKSSSLNRYWPYVEWNFLFILFSQNKIYKNKKNNNK